MTISCIATGPRPDLSRGPSGEKRRGHVGPLRVGRLVALVLLILAVRGDEADALTLVLERRVVERLPPALLALVLRRRRPDLKRLGDAVDRDVAEVGRALDVDQNLDAGDRPGRDGHLVTAGGDRRR